MQADISELDSPANNDSIEKRLAKERENEVYSNTLFISRASSYSVDIHDIVDAIEQANY